MHPGYIWELLKSLEHNITKKNVSSEIRESMFDANSFLRGFSLDPSFCRTCNLYGYLFGDTCEIVCAVVGGNSSSLDALRMDEEGELSNFYCTQLIISAVIFGLPLLLSSLTDPDFEKFRYQRRIDLVEGVTLP